MKKMTILFFVGFLFTTTFSFAMETSIRIAGNGGHPFALEFSNLAFSICDLLKNHPQSLLPNEKSADQFLFDIQNANPPLEIRVAQSTFCETDFACNYPDENLIYLNEKRWKSEFTNPIDKITLIFHELLEVLYDEDKSYQFSQSFNKYLTQNPDQVIHILQSQSYVDLEKYLKSYKRLSHLLFSKSVLDQYTQSKYLDNLIKTLKKPEIHSELKSNWLFWLRPSSLKVFKHPWTYEQHLSAEIQVNKQSSSIINLSWMTPQDSLLTMVLNLLSTSINEIKIKSDYNPNSGWLSENLNLITENKGEIITALDEFQKKYPMSSNIKVIKEERCNHKKMIKLTLIDLETNEVLTIEPSRQIHSSCEEQKIIESLENEPLEQLANDFETIKWSGYNYEIPPALRFKLNAETDFQTSILDTVKTYATVNLGILENENLIEVTEKDFETTQVTQDMAKFYNSYTCNQDIQPVSDDLILVIHTKLKDLIQTQKNIATYVLKSDKGIRSLIFFNKETYEELLMLGELFYVGPNMCDDYWQQTTAAITTTTASVVAEDTFHDSPQLSTKKMLKEIKFMYCGPNQLFDQKDGITNVCVGKIEVHMLSLPVFILKQSNGSIEIFNVLNIKDTTEPNVKTYEVYDFETPSPLIIKTFVLVFDPLKSNELINITGEGKHHSFNVELSPYHKD